MDNSSESLLDDKNTAYVDDYSKNKISSSVDISTLHEGMYDCIGPEQLINCLREKIEEDDHSLRYIAGKTNISAQWLSKFCAGQPVCFSILNRLANHYSIKFCITNFEPGSDRI